MRLELRSPIPNSLLDTEILDKSGTPVKFSDVLDGECSMVVMVRHFWMPWMHNTNACYCSQN